jgi:hypothetical protein
VLDVFVLDTVDAAEATHVAGTGVRVVVADTLPARSGHSEDLVDVLLEAGALGVAAGRGTVRGRAERGTGEERARSTEGER